MWAKSDMSDTKKSLPQFLFLQIKGHYGVSYNKCLALMIITIYIWFIVL